jgi:type VI secretion system secreted protein VgrG
MLETLEERTVPSLIASQFLPPMVSGLPPGTGLPPGVTPSATTVSVLPTALTFSATTGQIITLTANVAGLGGPLNGGTVNFTVVSTLTGAVLGTVNNVPVSNGVAQTPFTVPAGTPPGSFTISAVFSGSGTSSGSNGSSQLTISPPVMATNCDSPAADAFLATAQRFAVLGASTVTNTGPTNIVGDVGVSPGTAVTGFPPGSLAVGKPGSGGTIHSADAIAIQARNDVITAFNNLAGEPTTNNLTGKDLGGLTLAPGVYRFNSSAQLTGTLTLDAGGNANARFDFQIGSTLTTASSSVVQVINGGSPDNVFWQVGSSATLGTTTEFAGNILALTSITLNTRASIACGRALAINGAVTLDTNFIDPSSMPTGPSAAFIRTLYAERLGRDASAPEVEAWMGVLDTSGRAGVVQGIELSPEARGRLVDSWYQQYLGRPAQGGEEMGWANLLVQGRSEADVLSGILDSGEFAQRSGQSNEQFVRTLYSDLLKRTASDAEVQVWIQSIAAAGRQAVAEDFLNSREFRADAVSAFYMDLLGHQADQAGFNGWMSSNLDITQIRMGILESSEFGSNASI